jgi:hypothetical protein
MRTTLEVADVFRRHGAVYRQTHDGRLGRGERKVMKPPLAADLVRVAPRGPGEKARVAKIIPRAGKVWIKRPKNAPRTDPKVLEIGFVEAIERNPPQGVKPLVWRILTTLPVEIADDAKEVVRFYRLRWRIEEVFRALKSDGLALEDTQVQDSARLDTLLLNPPLRHSRKRPSRSVNPLAFMGREDELTTPRPSLAPWPRSCGLRDLRR